MTFSRPVSLAPLAVTVSQTSLAFDDLDSFEELWAGCVEPAGVCLVFFS